MAMCVVTSVVQTAEASSCRPGARGAGVLTSSSRHHSPVATHRDPSPLSFGAASSASATSTMTTVVANTGSGYLASVVSADDPVGLVGTAACPWLIAALPGQRINVTFYNFVGKLCHAVCPCMVSLPRTSKTPRRVPFQ